MKTVKRYRLMFVSENTLNTLWTLRLSRGRAWLAGGCAVAAVAALLFVLFWLTPLGMVLPGYMKPSQRRSSVENLERVDSMLLRMSQQRMWADNLLEVMQGRDSLGVEAVGVAAVGDTLLVASEKERRYVDDWTRRERFNLQVVSPLRASVVSFRPPVGGVQRVDSVAPNALRVFSSPGAAAVSPAAGTCVDVHADIPSGLWSVMVQHEQGFLTRLDGLVSVDAAVGEHLSGGQALGHLASKDPWVMIAMWHNGLPLDPRTVAAY